MLFVIIWVVCLITCVAGMPDIAKKHKIKTGSVALICFALIPFVNILGALLVLFNNLENKNEQP